MELAEHHLDLAKEALCKPEEDVVPYSVCKNSYDAVINYLTGYLMSNGREVPENHTVQELLAFCREVDASFKELHLSPFNHPTETEDVWMNMDAAKDFLAMAERTREMVQPVLSKS